MKQEAVFVAEDSDVWLATQRVLESEAFREHFARGGGQWWHDIRNDFDALGTLKVQDAQLVIFKSWMANNAMKRRGTGYGPVVPSVQTIDEVVAALSRANSRDEVREYLEDRRGKYDGHSIIGGALADAMGFSLDERGQVERGWLRRWLVSAVARAMRPGCKADCALVLMGAQGVGKSTSLGALFGEEWMHDSAVDMESKDGAAIMARAWCVELAELASMRRASDVETVKHFLSLCQDTFRAPYARRANTHPRRAVVAGTTNESTPFVDPTGNRRFWPVRVVRAADVAWVAAHRDAVWAEALAAYEAGEKWHLEAEEAATQTKIVSEYTQGDEWTESLRSWVDSLAYGEAVRLTAAATVLGLEDKDLRDRGVQRRIADCVRALGLERVHTAAGARWRRPDPSDAK